MPQTVRCTWSAVTIEAKILFVEDGLEIRRAQRPHGRVLTSLMHVDATVNLGLQAKNEKASDTQLALRFVMQD